MNYISPLSFHLFSILTFLHLLIPYDISVTSLIFLTMSSEVSHCTRAIAKKIFTNRYYCFWQNIADQNLGSAPEVVNPGLLSLYDTSPEVLYASGLEPRLGEYQEGTDLNIGLEPPKGKIWGMKRKTFMVVLGIVILLITAGVGGGVAGSAAKKR